MKKSPIQLMFEQMAADIMQKYQAELMCTWHEDNRVKCIKNMKAELLALKETYEGLLSGPIMDTAFHEVMGLQLQ